MKAEESKGKAAKAEEAAEEVGDGAGPRVRGRCVVPCPTLPLSYWWAQSLAVLNTGLPCCISPT